MCVVTEGICFIDEGGLKKFKKIYDENENKSIPNGWHLRI